MRDISTGGRGSGRRRSDKGVELVRAKGRASDEGIRERGSRRSRRD